MNKLGFIINMVQAGKQTKMSLNTETGWAAHVPDIRTDLQMVNFVPGRTSCVYMLTFDRNGCYFYISRPISGRGSDCVYGCIYIPSSIAISETELARIIEGAAAELNKSTYDTNKLNVLFSKEYPPKLAMAYQPSPVAGRYAYRLYNTGSLSTLLGGHLYQPDYPAYKAVFFIDAASGVTCPQGVNLTGHPLVGYYLLNAPQPVNGFNAWLNGQKRLPQIVQGGRYNIVWKRPGYEDITKPMEVVRDNQLVPQPASGEFKIPVSMGTFCVLDDKGKPVPDGEYTLTVDGKKVTDEKVAVPENKTIKVEVSSRDGWFDTKTIEMQITPTTSSYPVKVQYKTPVHECEVTGANGMTTKRDGIPLKLYIPWRQPVPEDLLEGYRLIHPISGSGTYRLIKNPSAPMGLGVRNNVTNKNEKKSSFNPLYIVAVVAGLIVGVAGCLGVQYFLGDKQEEEVEASDDFSSDDTGSLSGISQAAIDYLDNNSSWDKDSLDVYPETKGLYDELNKYDFSAVTARFNALSSSEKFRNLCDAIEKVEGKSSLENSGKQFVSDGKPIDVDAYINKIKGGTKGAGASTPATTPAEKPTAPSSSPSSSKSSAKKEASKKSDDKNKNKANNKGENKGNHSEKSNSQKTSIKGGKSNASSPQKKPVGNVGGMN